MKAIRGALKTGTLPPGFVVLKQPKVRAWLRNVGKAKVCTCDRCRAAWTIARPGFQLVLL